jgi:hypothetical protein
MSTDENDVRAQTLNKVDETTSKLKIAREGITNNTLTVERVSDLQKLLNSINLDTVLSEGTACW